MILGGIVNQWAFQIHGKIGIDTAYHGNMGVCVSQILAMESFLNENIPS